MNIKKQMIKNIVLFIAGVSLLVAGILCKLDGFWTGMGGALISVSIVRLFQIKKYQTDPAYAKQIDISNHDERRSFVSDKAMVLTMKLVIYIALSTGILLYILGQVQYGQFCMYGISAIMLLYIISFYIVNRKY